jgi:hypothetical protein
VRRGLHLHGCLTPPLFPPPSSCRSVPWPSATTVRPTSQPGRLRPWRAASTQSAVTVVVARVVARVTRAHRGVHAMRCAHRASPWRGAPTRCGDGGWTVSERRGNMEAVEKPRGDGGRQWGRPHGGRRGPWHAPAA